MVLCDGCGAAVDPVWSWCPDCGGLLCPDDHPLDLRAMDAELEARRRSMLLEREHFPTEWAQSA